MSDASMVEIRSEGVSRCVAMAAKRRIIVSRSDDAIFVIGRAKKSAHVLANPVHASKQHVVAKWIVIANSDSIERIVEVRSSARVLFRPLSVHKKEQLICDDRTAEITAKLIPLEV